jgi:hypothetical protein
LRRVFSTVLTMADYNATSLSIELVGELCAKVGDGLTG